MAALIEAVDLKKNFGEIQAVAGISLAVPKGEVLGFLGPNGAGKSTTMKMITGFLEPASGTALVCGHDVFAEPKLAKSKFGYLPEGAPSYGEMTVRDFLAFIAEVRRYRGTESEKKIAAAVEKSDLKPVLGQTIETLSKGFKRRVGLAQAILHDPPVLIMDEPTDGLDPNQKHHVRGLIKSMAAEKAIIISTHILEEVEAVCSRAVVINKGRIVASGTAEELMQRMPNHGAVLVRVAQNKAEEAAKLMSASARVSKVETVSKANGHVQLRALPGKEALDPIAIASLLESGKIPVAELSGERGRLDDVFRQITEANAGGRHA